MEIEGGAENLMDIIRAYSIAAALLMSWDTQLF